MDILNQVYQTADEWSSEDPARRREVVQELSRRHVEITTELQDVPSSTNVIPDHMRENILGLFSDIVDNILGQIQQLVRDVGGSIPYVIDNALIKYRMDTVWRSMDVYSDCISWHARLLTVADDISSWFVPANKVTPDEDASLRGSMLDRLSEKSHKDLEQAVMAKMQRKFTNVSRHINSVALKKTQQESSVL